MQETTKFEFVLTLQNNIIIQRYFNVKDFNPKSKYSMDLYEIIKNISVEIANDLKIKTSDYLCQNQNYFYGFDGNYVEEENPEVNYILEIKSGDEVFIQRSFPAHYYHPKVRYTVDIRPKIRSMLADLTDVLSSKKLVTTYMGYDLLT